MNATQFRILGRLLRDRIVAIARKVATLKDRASCRWLIDHFRKFENLAAKSPIWDKIFAAGSAIWSMSFRRLWGFLRGSLRLFRTSERISTPVNPARRRLIAGGFAVVLALSALGLPTPAWAATTRFVDGTAGLDTNAGTSWSVPYQTVNKGLSVSAAGDIVVVGSTGSFTATAAITWTPPAGGIAVISCTNAGSGTATTWATGATEIIGAASSPFTIAAAAGSGVFAYGMHITAGSNNNANCYIALSPTAAVNGYFEAWSCTFELPGISTGSFVDIGPVANAGQGSKLRLRDCTALVSGSRGGSIIDLEGGSAEFINLTISTTGATKPVNIFQSPAKSAQCAVTVKDSDLSGFSTASSGIVLLTNWAQCSLQLINCKLHATPALTTGTWPEGLGFITVRNSDSANTDYVSKYVDAYGTLTASNTIYKNSGSTFNSENVSWQIVTTSLASEFKPFKTPFLQIWDSLTSAQTATVDIARASGSANLTNRDVWVTLDYSNGATTTQYTNATGRNANPFTGTAVDWTASSATWTGISTPVVQILNPAGNAGTVTPARAGTCQARIFVGVASATIYVNPKVDGIS